MEGHWQRAKGVIAAGERLVATGQNKEDIQTRIYNLHAKWEQLRKVSEVFKFSAIAEEYLLFRSLLF